MKNKCFTSSFRFFILFLCSIALSISVWGQGPPRRIVYDLNQSWQANSAIKVIPIVSGPAPAVCDLTGAMLSSLALTTFSPTIDQIEICSVNNITIQTPIISRINKLTISTGGAAVLFNFDTIIGTLDIMEGEVQTGSNNITITNLNNIMGMGKLEVTTTLGIFTITNINNMAGSLTLAGPITGAMYTINNIMNANGATIQFISSVVTLNIMNSIMNLGIINFNNNYIPLIFDITGNTTSSIGGTIMGTSFLPLTFQGNGAYTVNIPASMGRFNSIQAMCTSCTINQTGNVETRQFIADNNTNLASYNVIGGSSIDIDTNWQISGMSNLIFNLNGGTFTLGATGSSINNFDSASGTFNAGTGGMVTINGLFNPSGGIFNADSATITVNNDVSSTMGTFNSGLGGSSAGSLTVGNFIPSGGDFNGALLGSFTIKGGNFAPSGGNFTFPSDVTIDLFGGDRILSAPTGIDHVFNNLTIINTQAPASNLICSGGQTVTVNNNFRITGTQSNILTFTNGGSANPQCIFNLMTAQPLANFANLRVEGINSMGSNIAVFPVVRTTSVTVTDDGNNLGWFVAPAQLNSLSIVSAVASDTIGIDNIYNTQDTILILFDNDTNFELSSPTFSRADLDNSLIFSQSLGADYTATWVDTRQLLINIVDSSGATPPVVGSLTISLKNTPNLLIKNRTGRSISNVITPITATGSFAHANYQPTPISIRNITTIKVGPTVFRPSLHNTIRFMNLPDRTTVEIRDITGRKIYSQMTQSSLFEWDVRSNNGLRLGSGVYFVYFSNANRSRMIKIIVIR